MNLVDRTCSGIERHVGDVTLEEGATTQFDETELTGIDIKRAKLLLLAMQRQTDAARHVDVETTILLVLSRTVLLRIGAV